MRTRVFEDGYLDDLGGDKCCKHARIGIIASVACYRRLIEMAAADTIEFINRKDFSTASTVADGAADYKETCDDIIRQYDITDEEIARYNQFADQIHED